MDHLRKLIYVYLEETLRGGAAEIALNTSVTASELSLFFNGHRSLTAEKVIEVIDWLVSEDRVVLSIQG